MQQISEKGYDFLLSILKLTMVIRIFLVFAPMLSSLMLDRNKKITYWISTGILSENIKPFDTKLGLNMYNLANGTVIIKFNNSVIVENSSSSL